jgi:hypothetical protein
MGAQGHPTHRLAKRVLLGGAALLVLACSPRPDAGSGALEVLVRTLSSRPITQLAVALQAPGVLASPRTLSLPFAGERAIAVINDLPAGEHYVVTVQGHGPDGGVVAQGIAAALAVRGGGTTRVVVYLHDLAESGPSPNRGPLIDAFALSSDDVPPGGVILLTATAHDPDPGQTATLEFSWRASCGSLGDTRTVPGKDSLQPSTSSTVWTAPATGGDCRITLTVKDLLGLASSVTVNPRSFGSRGTGNAEVSLVFNEPPSLAAISAAPAQLSSTGPTRGQLAAIVTDPEDDALGFAWSSDPAAPCRVTFDSPTAASTGFVAAPAGPLATFCTFLVTVDDGVWPGTTLRRNTAVAALTLSITEPVVAQLAPRFSIGYQSHDVVAGGDTVVFGATVTDPAGGSLDYAWVASAGPMPEATPTLFLGLDPSFTTAATWTVPHDVDSAGTDFVVNVTATSSASQLSSAASFALALGAP